MGLENKNVFITGISGFVGSHIAKFLVDRNSNVFGLARRRADGSRPKNLVEKGILDEVKLMEGDITDITAVGFALRESKPDVIFHLASQSFVPTSFSNPLATLETNTTGTANLLESVRLQELNPVIVFAGSSEEYGLVCYTQNQYQLALKKYGNIFPPPERLPELPINEDNPLRPLSPYAVSKVHGEHLMRGFFYSYGIKSIVSRGFNQEGAGRGPIFVTSAITNQVMKLKLGETDKILLGNVNIFRDWSHISDIVEGYCLLAEKGKYGDVYVQGSMRTNSVLSYALLSLERGGWEVEKIESMRGGKIIEEPTQRDYSELFGFKFAKTKVDKIMLQEELEFGIEDGGIRVYTDKGKIPILFDQGKFRQVDVPILFSDCRKIQEIGFRVSHKLEDIIDDQLNYFSRAENRNLG
jgi:GDPmannose 4,6-dehydratase